MTVGEVIILPPKGSIPYRRPMSHLALIRVRPSLLKRVQVDGRFDDASRGRIHFDFKGVTMKTAEGIEGSLPLSSWADGGPT